MKKFVSLLLALCMALAGIPAYADFSSKTTIKNDKTYQSLSVKADKLFQVESGNVITFKGNLTVKGQLNLSVYSEVIVKGKVSVSSTGAITGDGTLRVSSADKITGADRIFCTVDDGTDYGFVHAEGRNIVDGNGNAIQLRGIAFTNGIWTEDLETYKISNPKESYKMLAEMGFNSTRFCMSYEMFEDDSKPYTYKQSGWDMLDENIAYAKRFGIGLVLNIHMPQGGYQSQGNGLELWTNKENQKRLIALWTAIAERYADEPAIIGYGIVNEPVTVTQSTAKKTLNMWKDFAQDITDSIRTVDKNHIIFVEKLLGSRNAETGAFAYYNANDYGNMVKIKDNNVVYEFHCYEPMQFTHQLFSWAGYDGKAESYPTTVTERKNYEWVGNTSQGGVAQSGKWEYVQSEKFTVPQNYAANTGSFNLAVGGNGTVFADDVTLTEYDMNGNIVRTIISENFDSYTNISYWSDDKSGYAVYNVNEGNNNKGCIEVGGVDGFSSTVCGETFDLVAGHSYQVTGYVKCTGMKSGSYADLGISFSHYDIVETTIDKAYIEKTFKPFIDFSKKYKVPLYMGEFGFNMDALSDRGGKQWLTDIMSICDKNNIGWDYWSLRGGFGLFADEDFASADTLVTGLYDTFTSYFNKRKTDKILAVSGGSETRTKAVAKGKINGGELNSKFLTSIASIKGYTNLTSLTLSNNCIADISSLKLLTKLTGLDLSGNELISANGLEALTKLKSLDLSSNNISNISALKKLTALTELNLSGNKINDISALKKLTKLKTLYIYGNEISSSQLKALKKALPKCKIYA